MSAQLMHFAKKRQKQN